MAKTFSYEEQRIRDVFPPGQEFIYKKRKYTVIISGKPTSRKGEPKTDIFILARHGIIRKTFKISFKMDNAEFLENKISAKRAYQLFGFFWKHTIKKSIRRIKKKIKERTLISGGSVTLGWRLDLLNTESGTLSGLLRLSKRQMINLYAGTRLGFDKKHAKVGWRRRWRSGVANFMLYGGNVSTAQDVIDSMIPIRQFVKDAPEVYFALKALNYRTHEQKYDGDRPLAVSIKWYARRNKLRHKLIFRKPLKIKGNRSYHWLEKALNRLDVSTTDELNESNVWKPTIMN